MSVIMKEEHRLLVKLMQKAYNEGEVKIPTASKAESQSMRFKFYNMRKALKILGITETAVDNVIVTITDNSLTLIRSDQTEISRKLLNALGDFKAPEVKDAIDTSGMELLKKMQAEQEAQEAKDSRKPNPFYTRD